jgi:hypothetical protein
MSLRRRYVPFTADTITVAYNYRFIEYNPHSSKLLFLAEALKLGLASCFYLLERSGPVTPGQLLKQPVPVAKVPQGLSRARSELRAMLVFAVPAVCYFITNK